MALLDVPLSILSLLLSYCEISSCWFYPTTEKLSLSVHSAIKCETKKVKGIWFSLSSCFSVVPGKPPEFQYLRLFSCQFQSVFCKAFFQPLLKYFCFILVLKTTDKIITVSDKITLSFTLSLHDYIKPVIQYIMQVYICKYRTCSISLCKESNYAK